MPGETVLTVFLLLLLIAFFVWKNRKKTGKRFLQYLVRGFFSLSIFVLIGLPLTTLNAGGYTKVLMDLPLVSEPWPENIHYYNNSDYQGTLELAIKRWHQTGVPVRFIEVKDRGEADIIIEDDKELLQESCIQEGCQGHARIGYTALDWRENIVYLSPLDREDKMKEVKSINARPLIVAMHELGHVLGLEHNAKKCSIMNTESSKCLRDINFKINERGTSFVCGPFISDTKRLGSLYSFQAQTPSPRCQDNDADWEYYVELLQLDD